MSLIALLYPQQFAASIPAIIYALLGTSRHLNVAPEAALSLLLGQAVDDIRHDMDNPHSPEGDAVGLSVATIITLQVQVSTGSCARFYSLSY